MGALPSSWAYIRRKAGAGFRHPGQHFPASLIHATKSDEIDQGEQNADWADQADRGGSYWDISNYSYESALPRLTGIRTLEPSNPSNLPTFRILGTFKPSNPHVINESSWALE